MSESSVAHWSDSARLQVLALTGLALLVAAIAIVPARHAPANADEFVYLVGAQRYATTGSLDAVYYDLGPLLTTPFPFQDVHAPGYIMMLGLLMRLIGPGYWTAIVMNIFWLVLSSWLIWDTLRALGCRKLAPLSAACFLFVPTNAVYSAWVMSEVTLCAAVLVPFWIAARFGHRVSGALICGASLGLAILMRESAVFVAPALIGLLCRSRKSVVAFALGTALFVGLVFIPLSKNRGPGGANLSKPMAGQAVGAAAILATRSGDLLAAAKLSLARARRNAAQLASAGTFWPERLILGLYLTFFLWGLSGARRLNPQRRGLAIGLGLGFVGMIAVLFFFFIVGGWSGYRYLMVMTPPLLLALPEPRRGAWTGRALLLPATLVVFCVVASVLAFRVLDAFKRHGEDAIDEIAYVNRYIKTTPERIVWQNGFDYGRRHFPSDVIVSVPQDVSTFKALENAVWFDYVVLSTWQTILDDRGRYELVNRDDTQPLLKIFRRLR